MSTAFCTVTNEQLKTVNSHIPVDTPPSQEKFEDTPPTPPRKRFSLWNTSSDAHVPMVHCTMPIRHDIFRNDICHSSITQAPQQCSVGPTHCNQVLASLEPILESLTVRKLFEMALNKVTVFVSD